MKNILLINILTIVSTQYLISVDIELKNSLINSLQLENKNNIRSNKLKTNLKKPTKFHGKE